MGARKNPSAGGLGRRGLLTWLAATAASACHRGVRPLLEPGPGKETGRPPNIIFILADDLGWAELGCYGNRFNRTPHLDALAQQGIRFTDAYASSPVCSPTRVSLMTGQYPLRSGITDYLDVHDERFLSPRYTTLAEQLVGRGYETALVGKWHLMGDYARRRGPPSLHGFQHVLCSEEKYIGDGDYFAPYDFLPQVEAREANEYLTDRLNQEAVDFIRAHHAKPFFLYLSHYAVHTRLEAKPDLVERYRTAARTGAGRDHPVLAAMLQSVDEGVGRMVRTLQDLGLEEDTLIVFTSDNGGEHTVTSNSPLRGAKSQLYEGGIRVPLVVRWGRGRGVTSTVPTSTVDFYPTLLQLAGASADPAQVMDGVSLAQTLREPDAAPRRDALYWHYPLQRPHFLGGRSSGAVREGDFKLLEFFDTGELELYDLRTDLSESTNLAGQLPERAAAMRARLTAWREAALASRG
jgi:arylsulfatase A-like enzyme